VQASHGFASYIDIDPAPAAPLRLAARGQIGSKVTKYSLDAAPDAYRALKAGEIEGRAVIVPFESA